MFASSRKWLLTCSCLDAPTCHSRVSLTSKAPYNRPCLAIVLPPSIMVVCASLFGAFNKPTHPLSSSGTHNHQGKPSATCLRETIFIMRSSHCATPRYPSLTLSAYFFVFRPWACAAAPQRVYSHERTWTVGPEPEI